MLLTAASITAMKVLDELGLTAQGWSLRWTSSVRVLGYCDYEQKTITLSKQWVSQLTEEEVIALVKHEGAHAIVGYSHREGHHGPTWQRVAAQFGVKSTECGRFDGQLVTRFVATCSCKKVFSRPRLPKVRRLCKQCRMYLAWVDLRGQNRPAIEAGCELTYDEKSQRYEARLRSELTEGQLIRE